MSKKMQHVFGTVEKDSIDRDEHALWSAITTLRVDRDGEVVLPQSVRADDYNGTVLSPLSRALRAQRLGQSGIAGRASN